MPESFFKVIHGEKLLIQQLRMKEIMLKYFSLQLNRKHQVFYAKKKNSTPSVIGYK
jgi:hypothetical protein